LTARLGLSADAADRLFDQAAFERLQKAAWPGNVRELRNFVERCCVMDQALPVEASPSAGGSLVADPRLSYAAAKRRILDEFEHQYLTQLLHAHGGNVSAAARAAQLDRPYMYKLLYRHGLRAKD
jgi:DNA-binding NtrC family response regulator